MKEIKSAFRKPEGLRRTELSSQLSDLKPSNLFFSLLSLANGFGIFQYKVSFSVQYYFMTVSGDSVQRYTYHCSLGKFQDGLRLGKQRPKIDSLFSYKEVVEEKDTRWQNLKTKKWAEIGQESINMSHLGQRDEWRISLINK